MNDREEREPDGQGLDEEERERGHRRPSCQASTSWWWKESWRIASTIATVPQSAESVANFVALAVEGGGPVGLLEFLEERTVPALRAASREEFPQPIGGRGIGGEPPHVLRAAKRHAFSIR
jgi:hypothetical protein